MTPDEEYHGSAVAGRIWSGHRSVPVLLHCPRNLRLHRTVIEPEERGRITAHIPRRDRAFEIVDLVPTPWFGIVAGAVLQVWARRDVDAEEMAAEWPLQMLAAGPGWVDPEDRVRERRCRGCGCWVEIELLDPKGFGPDCAVQAAAERRKALGS